MYNMHKHSMYVCLFVAVFIIRSLLLKVFQHVVYYFMNEVQSIKTALLCKFPNN